MGRATNLLLAAVAVLLSAAIARADTTYTITPVPGGPGATSGSITGTGTTVTAFDFTATGVGPGDVLETFTFDSADAGSLGSLSSQDAFTASGTPINAFDFVDSDDDFLVFDVTGDFTTGFTALSAQNFYNSSDVIISTGGGSLTVTDIYNDYIDVGSISLAPDVAATPEPSSWLLLATGLTGLCALALRQNRPNLTQNHHAPGSLSA